MLEIIKVAGIEYQKPEVKLLQGTGLGVSELAARTCYDSFENSENECIKNFNFKESDTNEINEIENSDLLSNLAWVHHHHSVLEHSHLSFFVKGISRGVLQEHARHRLQNISVRSTRYTMQSILNAFMACNIVETDNDFEEFVDIIKELDMFVVYGEAREIEIKQMYHKLYQQLKHLGKAEFSNLIFSKSAKELFKENLIYTSVKELWKKLNKAKPKRNVGDSFKWIVTDNWKVDMVITFNLRSLKNYFDLRDSGAAYFQIKWLAQEIKLATPSKYLDLIVKKK